MSDALPSALLDLVQFLRLSQDTVGLVKIPITVEDAAKRDLLPQSTISMSCVEAIVAALDHQEPSLCSRLDLHAFVIVYLILSKAEDCAAQQRGLALLTESLQNIMSPLQDPSRGLEKKIRLGQKALSFLIHNFGNHKKMRWTRRWMGIFALELLSGCNENRILLLKKAQDSWRSIGDNILHETCEILKLVAGLLINELWPQGPPTGEPWFSEQDSAIYASFPIYTNYSSRWIVDFESFVDGLEAEGFLSEIRSGVSLAYGVSIGSDLAYGWEDQSTILVTVSTELNIAVCASENSSARYIDILLDRIESVSLEKRPRTSQANPLVPDNLDVLVIYLIKFSDNSLYLGAGKRFAPLINIAFTSVDEATVVLKRLLQRAPHIVEKFTCSESEPLNLSQPMVEENEEQGMLSAAAAQAPNTRPVIITSSTEPVSLPNFIREHEPDLSHSFLNWPKKFSAGPLNTTDLTDLRSDSGISIENIQVDSVVSRSHTPTKNLEDMSEGSLRNSAEWRKGAILIENAPELQDTKDRAVEKEELFGKYSSPDKVTFVDRDGDCDGFYNATPKGQAANVERAEHVSTHNERRQGLPQALDHTLVHRAKNHDSNKEFKADIGRNTVADAAELEIQASKNRGHVNVNMAEVRKSAVIKRKYTSNRKLPATNASKTSKKIANVKNQPDRKAESLGVNKGRFQRDKEGRDEFDFPLSPPKKRTPKTVRRPISKKAASKEGAIGSSTGKKPSAYRPVPPDEANHLVQNVAVQNNHPGTPPYKAPFESTKGKGPNDNPASINWDEKFVQDEKSNGLDLNPTEKRPPRGKAKSTLKRSKNKDNDAYSSKKVSGEKMRKSSHKTRSAPRPAPQPRSRRAAALIADQKIRNSIHCDTSQEQHRNGLTHDVELSRPHSSQQGLPPNGLANINPNIDSVGVSQAQPQKVSKLFEKDVLNYDGRPGVTSDTKLRPQDGDFKVQASSHAVKLAGHQRQHPVAVPEQSTLKRVPVHKTNGILDHDGGNRQTEESQLARFAAFTASPEGNVYIRMDENEIEHDESISHGNSIAKNSSKSFSVICHENTNFESPAPHPYMSNGAQETCSSEGLVSVLERSDSQRYSHPGVTPISSMIVVNGSKSRRFVEIGGKRRATGPEKSYQKAENGSNGRATTAVMTTTPSKRGNGFALNLKKALLSVTMSDEHHPAPESRRQGQLVEQDKNVLDTSLVRQSTNSPMSQILEVGPFRKGHQNQLLETAEMDLDVSTSDALQESVKMPERLRTTVSPWESARAFHNMENTRQEKNAFSRQHDENEMQIDESPNEEQSLNVQARRIQKRPKEAVLQPVYTPHRIRRVNSTERLCARAFNTWVTPTKISRDVHRKSNLISFNSRGPRNQGVILNQKDQLAGSSQPRISRLLAADLNKSLKRKLPIEAEEPSDLEVDLEDGKRPRISTKLLKVHDMAQRRSSIVTDAIHRPSSQSTRVNENGSPMPFIRSRHFIFRDHGRNDSTKLGKVSRSISDDDHGDLLAPGDRVESEPGIFAPRTRLTKAKKISWRSSSGSSKRKRYQEYLQSPKTDQFAAHRLHPNGGFIDVHTETEILPVRPADPFVEAARPHQNSFLEMLRRSSNPPYKSPLRNGVGPPGLNLDKGLDENHINSPSTESSSSDSSSREQWWSSSESSSGDEGGLYEEERWRDKLQPHQKGQLDALYSISQRLVARLIDAENTINDLVLANKRGGMRLVHEFEKARKQDIQVFRKSVNELQKKASSMIKEQAIKLKTSSTDRKIKRPPVTELEKSWEDQQRAMWAKLEDILAVSTN